MLWEVFKDDLSINKSLKLSGTKPVEKQKLLNDKDLMIDWNFFY